MKNYFILMFIFIVSVECFAKSMTTLNIPDIKISLEQAEKLGIQLRSIIGDKDNSIKISAPKIIDNENYLHTQVCLFSGIEKITCFFAMDSEEYDANGEETENMEIEFYFHSKLISKYEVNLTYGFLRMTYVINVVL